LRRRYASETLALMKAWLKLVGASDMHLPEHWAMDLPFLLREVRFGTTSPPDPISRGDVLVYHAVGHQRLLAVVEVLDDEPTLDPAPLEWEKRWPLILRVRTIVKVGRVSKGPASISLGPLPDLAHKSFVPLTPAQLTKARSLLDAA
jgi:hypothetical protein